MSDGQSPATTEQQDSNSGEGELQERMKLRTRSSFHSKPPVATRASENGFYVISVAACGAGIATCFVATATPQGDQTADLCTTLTLNSVGVRGATGGTAAECWQR